MAPVRIRLSLNCHAIQEYENDTKKKQVHNHEHIESGGNLMLFVRSLATDFSKLADSKQLANGTIVKQRSELRSTT